MKMEIDRKDDDEFHVIMTGTMQKPRGARRQQAGAMQKGKET